MHRVTISSTTQARSTPAEEGSSSGNQPEQPRYEYRGVDDREMHRVELQRLREQMQQLLKCEWAAVQKLSLIDIRGFLESVTELQAATQNTAELAEGETGNVSVNHFQLLANIFRLNTFL